MLYLQHGGGEDERGWPNQGRVSQIMDNLIAEGKARSMLIVMEQGYARKPGEPEVPLRPPPVQPTAAPVASADAGNAADASVAVQGPAPAIPPSFGRMFAKLDEVFTKDLIPMIDATYRTIPDREHRDGRTLDGRHADISHHA